MGDSNRYSPFPFRDIWSQGYPPLSAEEAGQNIDSALNLDSYPSSSITDIIPTQEGPDQQSLSVSQDLSPEPKPGSVVQFHNTIVSRQGYKIENKAAEEQRETIQQIRSKGACFACQIQKKRCTVKRPCERCEAVISGEYSDVSQYRRWTRQKCFILSLKSYDFFRIDCPVLGDPDNQTIPPSTFLVSRSDLLVAMDSPYNVLGQDNKPTAYPASTRSSFLEVFRESFDQQFAMHYSFFVNLGVMKLIQEGEKSDHNIVAPAFPTSPALQWQIVAGYRAYCALNAVQNLLDKGLGRALNCSEGERRLIGDSLNPKERVKKFVLFLVVVGALIAARRTGELFYIKSGDDLSQKLQPLTFRLAHCLVLLGTEWGFVNYDGSEQALVEEICIRPNKYVLSIIRQDLLKDWTKLISADDSCLE